MAASETLPQEPSPAAPSHGEEWRAPGFGDRLRVWFAAEGAWYAASFVLHMVMACVLMLLSVTVKHKLVDTAPAIEEAQAEEKAKQDTKLDKFEVGETPLDPTELNTETLTLMAAPQQQEQKEEYNDDNAVFKSGAGGPLSTAAGAMLGFGNYSVKGLGAGPAISARGGVGVNGGGGGEGFGARGTGHRKAMAGSYGATRASERAVAAALNWLARHQNHDGSWGFGSYLRQCKDKTCTGPGQAEPALTAATAMGLLPFLAAGQTHESRGPYKSNIYNGLFWMLKTQGIDGNLFGPGNGHQMYSHGIATIALCEAYGLTNDKQLGKAAQAAVNFIIAAQNKENGGWRYQPLSPTSDTSVVGWQLMALKSGHMASLQVPAEVFAGAAHWLDLAAGGKHNGLFTYTLNEEGKAGWPTPAMTAVGLLCRQYMGMKRDDPAMKEGMDFLVNHLPQTDAKQGMLYYWYYATQVMHNMPGPEWDKWNRQMRRVLIAGQVKEGCAAGSWDPQHPVSEGNLSEQGGRLLITALSALTLEVYYRYLPLYKLDVESGEAVLKSEVKGEPTPADKPAAKPQTASDGDSSKQPSKPAKKNAGKGKNQANKKGKSTDPKAKPADQKPAAEDN